MTGEVDRAESMRAIDKRGRAKLEVAGLVVALLVVVRPANACGRTAGRGLASSGLTQSRHGQKLR